MIKNRPEEGNTVTDYPHYPHTSWNSAERRAQAHSTYPPYVGPVVTVETLAQHCPVEQGRDYCIVCCAVSTDTPNNR